MRIWLDTLADRPFATRNGCNATRYNVIQDTTFGYTGWVPVPLEGRDPDVHSPLYHQIFATDVLGHDAEVQAYEIPDLPWNISAYGIYESGALSKNAVAKVL
ncbi:hypothetical protein DL768_000827 [Monosporascus sp. mg162]|nr:hypothetical protein DL768_000827 [Monosporascus sp. mg162]